MQSIKIWQKHQHYDEWEFLGIDMGIFGVQVGMRGGEVAPGDDATNFTARIELFFGILRGIIRRHTSNFQLRLSVKLMPPWRSPSGLRTESGDRNGL